MVARIYRPAKTAMSSGRAKTHRWVLEYEPERREAIEPLMGYTSSDDMRSQIRLEFDTQGGGDRLRQAQRHRLSDLRAEGARAGDDRLFRQFPPRQTAALDALAPANGRAP